MSVCGEHFTVGQSLEGGWPFSVCQLDQGHSGTHGFVPVPEPVRKVDKVKLLSEYEKGLVAGLQKAAQLTCLLCAKSFPKLSGDRITYSQPTWLHFGFDPIHPVKCPSTVIHEVIREITAA